MIRLPQFWLPTKAAGEAKPYCYDFATRLAPGDTIASVLVTIQPQNELAITRAPTISGSIINWQLGGGRPCCVYVVTISCSTTQGNLLVHTASLQITDDSNRLSVPDSSHQT